MPPLSTSDVPPPAHSTPPPSATLPSPAASRKPCSVQPGDGILHGAAREVSVLSSERPGLHFQELLLRDCFATIAPTFLGLPLLEPGTLWLTPSSSSSPLLLHPNQVSNILSFCLASPPVLLKARSCCPFVFSVMVASRNIARLVVLRSPLCLGSMVVGIHGDATAVEAAVARLACAFNAPNVQPPPLTPHFPT